MATPAQEISRLGFRVWYERQLIESHLWFVTGFLASVLIVAMLENLNLRGPGPLALVPLLVILVAGGITAFALRRYIRMLFHAEALAEQCNCPQCSAYGAIRVLDAGAVDGESANRPQWMRVACRRCSHQWVVNK